MSDDEFGEFLYKTVEEISIRINQIRSYFTYLFLIINDVDNIDKNYEKVYERKLIEFIETGTIEGRGII